MNRNKVLYILITLFGLGVAAFIFCYLFVFVFHSGSAFNESAGKPEPELISKLESHVRFLSEKLGERNTSHSPNLKASLSYFENELRFNTYQKRSISFEADGKRVENLEYLKKGSSLSDESIVVGAHYDTTYDTPGADDNGSGTAVLIELIKSFESIELDRSIRFVFFVNEEPPYFKTHRMGSYVYADDLNEQGIQVAQMIAIESVGVFLEEKNSQHYPIPLLYWFLPDRGNFIAVVGNLLERSNVKKISHAMFQNSGLPVEGAVLPSALPGVDWSDHWSFWQLGYPGVMVTNTALYRNVHYHGRSDTAEKLNYEKMAQVFQGLKAVILDLGGGRG